MKSARKDMDSKVVLIIKFIQNKVYNPTTFDPQDIRVHKPLATAVYGASDSPNDEHEEVEFESRSSPSKSHSTYVLSRRAGLADITKYSLDDIIEELRQRIKMRGPKGFIGLKKQFITTDRKGTQTVNQFEFTKILREYDLNLIDSQYQVLFDTFDHRKKGNISYKDFIDAVIGSLNEIRFKIIKKAFVHLDAENTGAIDFEYIKSQFIAHNHPDVLSGKKGEEEVYKEFISTFDTHRYLYGTDSDPNVGYNEWIEYYHNISANIDGDENFISIINNVWNLDGKAFKYKTAKPTPYYYEPSQKSATNESASSVKDSRTAKGEQSFDMDAYPLYHEKPMHLQVDPKGYRDSERESTYSKETDSFLPEEKKSIPKFQQILLSRLKECLLERGVKGLIGFTRQLRLYDTSATGYLDYYEFKQAVTDYEVDMIEIDIENLYKSFVKSGDEKLNISEFLGTLIEPMNKFSFLDLTNQGSLDMEELLKSYNPSQHPDVLNFKKEKEEVLMEFQESFILNHNLHHNSSSIYPE